MKNTAPNDSRFLDLLQRWLRGDFRRADEQALQELASEDEFRREAFEGYQLLPEEDHQARLKALQERLQSRIPDARRVTMWPRLLSIAAVLTLLVLAVWFMPGLWRDRTQDIAQQSPAVAPAPETVQPASPDATAPIPAPEPEPPVRGKKAPVQAPATSPAAGGVASAGTARSSDTSQEGAAEMTTDQIASAAKPAVSEAVEIVPPEDIALPKSASPPPAPAKTKEAVGIPLGRQAAGQTALGGQPAIGWSAFNDYLRRNARLTPEARNNNVSGSVRLEFSIDAGGKPTDFTILQPLGFGCDEKAIELVRGQSWLPGAGGRTQVEVWFRY